MDINDKKIIFDSELPYNPPDCEIYVGGGYPGFRVISDHEHPPVFIDFRPWCSEHGLMARGNGYWYCEDCLENKNE